MPYIGSRPPDTPITSINIVDGTIANTDMAAGAITPHALASGAVTAGKIAAGAVANTDMAAGAITPHALASDAVTAGKIAAGAVIAGEIAAGELTAGFSAAAYNAGTQTTGTYTPDVDNGNFQYTINGGAHTLGVPSKNCTMVILYKNNASAGTVTTSGYTKVDGDTISTTDGDEFFFYITRVNDGTTTFSMLTVKALQ